MQTTRIRTIADIARLAGVSKATVSRALNDSPLVSVETRERIRAIAQEHGFEMNDSARRLSRRQSNVVALVTYPYAPSETVPDDFVLEILSGLTAGLHAEDYDLLLIQTLPEETRWISRYLESGRVDGFVLLASRCTQEHLDRLAGRGAPFVVWGLPPEGRNYGTVVGDSFAGGRMATEHLLGRGCRRIAFIGGPPREIEVRDRYNGYVAALAAAEVELDESLVTHGDWSPASGAAMMRRLLERGAALDAVFACSDAMAVAAIDELHAHGRSVPGDVAVVGYDDALIASRANPPLTTVRQAGPLVGRLLAETLIRQLRTGAVTHVSIPAELVVRASA